MMVGLLLVVGATGAVIPTLTSGAASGAFSVEASVQIPANSAAVSCSSSQDCVAVGGRLASVTTDAGVRWTNYVVPGAVLVLTGVSCPTATYCLATGSTGDGLSVVIVSRDGGHSWKVSKTFAKGNGLNSIACPSPTECIAVGQGQAIVEVTDNTGSTWTAEPVSSSVATSLTTVSCSSTSDCVAGAQPSPTGDSAVYTDDGGRTWSAADIRVGLTANGVSCSGATCVAVVTNNSTLRTSVFSSIDSGQHWTLRSVPAGTLASGPVSCPSSLVCVALARKGQSKVESLVSTDGGQTWSAHLIGNSASNGWFLEGIDCATTSQCVAAGVGTASSTDGGVAWKLKVPTNPISLSGVTCPTSTNCLAVGTVASQGGTILSTTSGGLAWKTAKTFPISSALSLYGVACSTASNCVAVGGGGFPTANIVSSNDGGSTWSVDTIPSPDSAGLVGVACPAAETCIAVGSSASGSYVLTTADGGGTWTEQGAVTGVPLLDDVSCSSALDCVAVGLGPNPGPLGEATPVIATTTDGGVSWTATSTSTSIKYLRSASCSASGSCVLVGYTSSGAGVILTGPVSGSGWTQSAVPSGVTQLDSVSCAPDSTNCVAVGQAGSDRGAILASSDGGQTWTSQPVPTVAAAVNSVFCYAAGICQATAYNGTDVLLLGQS